MQYTVFVPGARVGYIQSGHMIDREDNCTWVDVREAIAIYTAPISSNQWPSALESIARHFSGAINALGRQAGLKPRRSSV